VDNDARRTTARRRGRALERAILRAAVDGHTASGYRQMADAYRQMADAALQPPDTGERRGDVLALLRQINRDLSAPNGDILRGLLTDVRAEPELLAQARVARPLRPRSSPSVAVTTW
jgi:hypothetical protein